MNTVFALVLISLAAADAAPTKPESRPAWVDAEPGLRNGTYEMQVLVGPESTREECEAKVLPAVRDAVDAYAVRWKETNGFAAENFAVADYSDEVLARAFIFEKWEEHVKVDGVDRIFLHVRLKFDAKLQHEWRNAAQAHLSQRRGIKLSAMFLLAMWGLGVAHVSLRVDGLLAQRGPGDAGSSRATRAVLWTTAGLLTAIPVMVVA